MITEKFSKKIYNLFMICLIISSTSCRQAVPAKNINYLSTVSGRVLSNCPDQSGVLCIVNIGEGQNIEIRNELVENVMSIALSPNGYVFAQTEINRSTSTSTIFIEDTKKNLDKREIVQYGFVSDLSWSGDETYLAFELFTPSVGENNCTRSLYVQSLFNRSNSKEPFKKCILDYAWSPFRNEVVVSSRGNERNETGTSLLKINVETGETITLIEPSDELVHMAVQWSPDGQTISFVEGIGSMESTGYLVFIDAFSAEELHRVLPQDCAWLSHDRLCYAWSPDSSEVAFIKSTNSSSQFSLEDLYVLNVENGNVEQITHTESYAIDDNFDRLGITLSHPLWLSSSAIAFFWTQDSRDYLVITDVEGELSLFTEYENIPQFYQKLP